MFAFLLGVLCEHSDTRQMVTSNQRSNVVGEFGIKYGDWEDREAIGAQHAGLFHSTITEADDAHGSRVLNFCKSVQPCSAGILRRAYRTEVIVDGKHG